MRKWALFLLLSLTMPSVYCQTSSEPPAQSSEIKAPAPPLNVPEKRQILTQLIELQSLRQKVAMYEEFFGKLETQNQATLNACDKAVAAEKEIASISIESIKKELELQKDKAAMYEQLYKAAIKKPGFGCTLKKIFTFGLARC